MVESPEFHVFLAHNSLDKPQVRDIARELKGRGLNPWLDEEQIPPGRSFQEEIEQAIPRVQSAAIFISLNGLGRWQVLELRSFISRCVDEDIPVIPVLLPGVDNIPGNLLFLQQFSWISCESIDEIAYKLEWGITGVRPPSPPPQHPTMYFEIQREPQESQCLETIRQPGSFLRIKGPRNMGKTRLLNRVLKRVGQAQQDNCQIVILNWQNDFDRTVFNTYDKFLENFCAAISQYLGLPPDQLDEYWNRRGSPNNKTTGYFSDYLLPQIESKLILALEEMDLVFDRPRISQDFCDCLRGWHQKSRRDDPLWQKLSLVIVHSTDKYASLDLPTSPLANVGQTVTVEEFTLREVDDLVNRYGLSPTSGLQQIIELVNRHPFLVNHAFRQIAREPTRLQEILAIADTQEGIYHDHLLELWNILTSQPALKEAFLKVVTESAPVHLAPDISFKLERLGLVKVNGNYASCRCQLYRQYFANNL